MFSATVTATDLLLLNCRIDTDTLYCLHEGSILPDDEAILELSKEAPGEVRVSDFDHEGLRYRSNASTIQADGTLEPWARAEDFAYSPALTASDEETIVDVLITAVCYDTVEPMSALQVAPLAPQTRQRRIRVRVRKQGATPWP